LHCDLVKLRIDDICSEANVRRWDESIGLLWRAIDAAYEGRRDLSQDGDLLQLLLGHSKLKSTVRYLGIEVDDALNMPSRSSFNRRRPALRRSSLARVEGSHSQIMSTFPSTESGLQQIYNEGYAAISFSHHHRTA
jgi:hypothetical protein